MPTIKTHSKGRIVIPAEMRKKYNIKIGTKLQITEHGGLICLVPPGKDPIRAAKGSLPPWPSLSRQLLRERRMHKP